MRPYLAVVGSLLLTQAAVSLVLRMVGIELAPLAQAFVNADRLHALVHIVWGLVLLLAVGFAPSDRPLATLALVFGLFYSALAIAGILVYHPFGLELGIGENAFHLVVGPGTLFVGARGARATRPPTQPSAPVSVG